MCNGQFRGELALPLNTAIKPKHCPCKLKKKNKQTVVHRLQWEVLDKIFRRACFECG